jgi:hypothetical protein
VDNLFVISLCPDRAAKGRTPNSCDYWDYEAWQYHLSKMVLEDPPYLVTPGL